LNIPVTNRKNVSDNYVDALLLVDEPHSVANPNVPLTLCGAPGVDCGITGTGNGLGVYSGASNRPNVFQGEIAGTNTIRFRLPIDIPANGSQRTFRIVNLRGDATQMVGRNPNAVTGAASIAGVSVPATIVGIAHPGIRFGQTHERIAGMQAAQMQGCKPFNAAWAANREGDIAPVSLETYFVPVHEGSPGAWRSKNSSQTQAAGRWGGAVNEGLSNLLQNVSGYSYGTESGFFNGSGASPAFPVPSLPATTQFPAVRGMERAGAADFGTRIQIRFLNVPAGVQIFLPVEAPLFSNYTRSGSAVMVQSEGGVMQRVTGGSRYGLAAMSQSGSTATAIYEVVSSDELLEENFAIPIFIASNGFAGSALPVMQLSARLVPSVGPPSPEANAVVPRFSTSAITEDAVMWTGRDCGGTSDLTIESIGSPGGSPMLIIAANIGSQASRSPRPVSRAMGRGTAPRQH